jgi:hypothetical protein
MNISKALSTLSLAGALVAAAVALSPSDAAAGFKSQTVVSAVVGGSGHAAKSKPKPSKPRMRECKASDRCRG